MIGSRASQKPGVLVAALRTLLLVDVDGLDETDIVARCAIRLMFARPQQDIEALATEPKGSRRTKTNILRDAMFEAVSAEVNDEGALMVRLDSVALFDSLDGAQQPIAHSDEPGRQFTYETKFDTFFEHIPTTPRARLHEFFLNDAQRAKESKAEA